MSRHDDGAGRRLPGRRPRLAIRQFCRHNPAALPMRTLFALTLAACWFLLSAHASTTPAPVTFRDVIDDVFASADAAHPAQGNRISSLESGYDALLLRLHLIRQARVSIDLQTFIWTNDECGRRLMLELIEAAQRGVRVRIIADHMFSEQDADIAAFVATVHPNLQVKLYRPAMRRLKPSLLHTLIAGARSFHSVNQRMHNKLLIIDGQVLITGGRNVENAYFDHALELNFRDRDLLAIGPVVHAAVESFEEFWTYRHAVATQDLVDVAAAIRRDTFRRYPTRAAYEFGPFFTDLEQEIDDPALIHQRFIHPLRAVASVTFIADTPGKSRGFWSKTARITRILRSSLETARETIVVQSPYLVLSQPARRLLHDLQERSPGLRVRISTNSFASTDNLLAYSANYRLRDTYIRHLNLEIYEFKPEPATLAEQLRLHPELLELAGPRLASGRQSRAPFLCIHAKSLVVDDRVAFVGSYNLDPRSENLNTEVGLLIEDEGFARALREEIEADMRPENSWVIARRPMPLRLDTVNGMISDILSLSPVDVWPIQNTTSYELRDGAEPVPTHDDRFHTHYREAGSFPGTEGRLTTKDILTRIYKTVGSPLTPIL
jgi:cardiolipin synthase C